MGLLTSKKKEETVRENSEYTAQIHAYKGVVYVEILKNSNDEWFRDNLCRDLYHTIMDNNFGSMFRNAPREKDWIKAHKWMNKQLDLIEKYGTVLIERPKCISDAEKLEAFRKTS
jgi:hypothetical protein